MVATVVATGAPLGRHWGAKVKRTQIISLPIFVCTCRPLLLRSPTAREFVQIATINLDNLSVANLQFWLFEHVSQIPIGRTRLAEQADVLGHWRRSKKKR